MNRRRHHLWTWLSVALYGAMSLAVQTLHIHDGGHCSSCGCGSSHCDIASTGLAVYTTSGPEPSKPLSPYEEDCPACHYNSQPQSLTAVVTPPEIGEAFEIAEVSRTSLHLEFARTTPPARGPPVL